jgi:hypothetical protein
MSRDQGANITIYRGNLIVSVRPALNSLINFAWRGDCLANASRPGGKHDNLSGQPYHLCTTWSWPRARQDLGTARVIQYSRYPFFRGVQLTDGQCLFVDILSGDFRAKLDPIGAAACDGSQGQQWDIITTGKHNDQPGHTSLPQGSRCCLLEARPRRQPSHSTLEK